MAGATAKPVIFISYSHRDEPDHPHDGEVQWLSFVRTYLQPAVKYGVFDLWVDRNLPGGADLDPEIKRKLYACDIFILLVSAHSMASDYIVDKEIAIIRERQAKGEGVHFYPLLLTPTPDAGLAKVKDKNLRPRDAKPFSGFSYHERLQHMTEAANEIAEIARKIVNRRLIELSLTAPIPKPIVVLADARTDLESLAGVISWPRNIIDIAHLPETAYEQLVGREKELKRLDDAWVDRKTNILSLVAEGGAGKSALVNEWLKTLQVDNYRSAKAVLGWSFYSQGSKERATSADEFLNWALEKLEVKVKTTSASTKGEAIAEAMMRRRVLLVLDGVEPLQHGPGQQVGQLKDLGLHALLRRFASVPPAGAHGLVLLTSRLPIKDIARWKDAAAPVVDVEKLSDESGATLLRDNGVWGTDWELKAAAHDFSGHPLALGLLASFLKEKYFGSVRRRDRIRELLHDEENPRHDHARRVMESYEREWLSDQPVLLAIMHMVGLFDRPASDDCLRALRKAPVIEGLTDEIVGISDESWRTAITRLREIGQLAPPDPASRDTLDAHPLVREWFGERLKKKNETAWRAAHSRLYDHLRRTTKEGNNPALEDLAPLYQAIAHGCRAGRHSEALENIYLNRICRKRDDGRPEFYAFAKLGATGSNLASVSWFFDEAYQTPNQSLTRDLQHWVLGQAAFLLRCQGRFLESLQASRAGLRIVERDKNWLVMAQATSYLADAEILIGEISSGVRIAARSVEYADRSHNAFQMIIKRTTHACALFANGKFDDAERLFIDAERLQQKFQPEFPLLYSVQGYGYCDLLLFKGQWSTVLHRVESMRGYKERSKGWNLISEGLLELCDSRAHIGSMLQNARNGTHLAEMRDNGRTVRIRLAEAMDGIHAAGTIEHLPLILLNRAAFRRNIGDWDGVARDLDEVQEIAESGPLRLVLSDMNLERARLALARIEVFVPLNGLVDDSPPKPTPPFTNEIAKLKDEARENLSEAKKLIETCGYHRRDEELTELEGVLAGKRRFADLPPRI